MDTYFATSEKIQVEGYPYGRLRTTVWYWVEFKKGFGFRSMFQSKDPKTGRINKPKAGTYYPGMFMRKDHETGHIKSVCLDFNGDDEMTRSLALMDKHFDLFTPEQIREIFGTIVTMHRVSMKANAIYCGADVDKLIPIFDPAVKAAVHGFKTGENVFAQCLPDYAAVKALADPNYNPFTVRHYTPQH